MSIPYRNNLIAILFLSLSILSAETPQELFSQFQANTKERISFSAQFEQVRHVSLFMDELKAEGNCWFEKPSRLRWEVETPYHSVLIYNDGEMARWEEQDGDWRKLDSGAKDMMSAVLQQITGWMQGDFDEASKMYDITYREPVLTLQPVNEELRKLIRSIDLTIDTTKWRITNVVIHENESDYVRITFTGQIDNPTIDSDLFDPDSHE